MPVYPPSSPFRFHLQLKRLLVPPCGAFSRRCLRPRCGCCLSSSFFSFFLSSLSRRPHLPLCFSFVQPLFCPSARGRARNHGSFLRALETHRRVVLVVTSSVSVRRSTMPQNPVRMREVATSAGESLPRVTSRLYPASPLYGCTYIARDGQLMDRGL